MQNLGAVPTTYLIGKYEVTNDQYTRYLNAIATTDSHSLYYPLMASDPRGGIIQSGTPGSYRYEAKPNMGNMPVIWVNFYDVLRFCNWMHNGMPTGVQDATTTEDGAYRMIEENYPSTVIVRKPGARAFIPSESEWYKAAFYDPLKNGTGGYFIYPTRSDTLPLLAKCDAFGIIINPSSNVANYNFGAKWNGQIGNITVVGSGGPGTESAYGAADMGGNVFEWTESIRGSEARILRGGSWGSWLTEENDLQSSGRYGGDPAVKQDNIGFRVARP
jgi:formylglycine-generating enzyme required for sulfatase activity